MKLCWADLQLKFNSVKKSSVVFGSFPLVKVFPILNQLFNAWVTVNRN